MEVNAGELEGIKPASQVSLEFLTLQKEIVTPGWVPAMTSFLGFALMGVVMVDVVRVITGKMSADEPLTSFESGNKGKPSFHRESKPASDDQCAFCGSSGHQSEQCDRVSLRDYHMLSWVGAPVPDYSFAVEPETKDRKIDEVLKRLKEGVDDIQQSDNFRQFLLTMSKFHEYSIGNLILIMLQKPNATRVRRLHHVEGPLSVGQERRKGHRYPGALHATEAKEARSVQVR